MELEAIENIADNEILCKICHCSCDDNGPYIHPCKCNGTLKYIHVECLNEWIKLTKTKKCSICNYSFKFEKKFKVGTPKSVPISYVVLFFLKRIAASFVHLLCLFYSIIKFLIIFIFNSAICQRYIYSTKSFHWAFLIAFIFTFINLVHSVTVERVLKCITSFRARIQSSAVLQSLISDISSRSADETLVSRQTQTEQDNSDTGETDEQFLESTNYFFDVNIHEFFFRRPSIANLKSDMKLLATFCMFSVAYPIIYHSSCLCSSVLCLFDDLMNFSGHLQRIFPVMFKFMEVVRARALFSKILGLEAFFCLLLFFLYQLKIRVCSHVLRNLYCLVKFYFTTVVSTLIVIYTVGSLTHFFFSISFNHGLPVFIFSQDWIQGLIHCILGCIFTYLYRNLKQKLMKRYRPGVLLLPFRDNSFSSLVDYCCNLTFGEFLIRVIINFHVILALPFTIFCLSQTSLVSAFEPSNELWPLLYLKSFLLLFRNSSAITNFLSRLYEIATLLVAKIFDAENYLYNKKTEIRDKSRLVWCVNTRFIEPKYEQQLSKINEIVKSKHEKIKPDQGFQSVPVDGVIRRRSIPGELEVSESVNESQSFSKDNSFRKTTPALAKSLNEAENDYIFAKYELTDKRIQKYYGKRHNKRFSIFYKPKYFRVFKVLSLFVSLGAICLFFNVLFRASAFLSQLMNLSKNKTTSMLFIYNSCLLLSGVSYIPHLFAKTRQEISKGIINTFLLAIYVDGIFPFVGAILFVILNASRNVFSEFSNAFIFLNAFSSVSSMIFETFFILSSIELYSVPYILRQIASFFGMKLALIFCFITYTKIFNFTSMYIPMIFTILIILQITRIVRALFSGSLMDNIKDHFFLDDTMVINYNHGKDE